MKNYLLLLVLLGFNDFVQADRQGRFSEKSLKDEKKEKLENKTNVEKNKKELALKEQKKNKKTKKESSTDKGLSLGARKKKQGVTKKITSVTDQIATLKLEKEELEKQEEMAAENPQMHTRITSRSIENKERTLNKKSKKLAELNKKLSKIKPVLVSELKAEAQRNSMLMDSYENHIDALNAHRASTLSDKQDAYHQERKRIQKLSTTEIEDSFKKLRDARYNHDHDTVAYLEKHLGMNPHDLKDHDHMLKAGSKERSRALTSLKKSQEDYDKVAQKSGFPSRKERAHEKLVTKFAQKEHSGLRKEHLTNLQKEVSEKKESINS